jgi:hypothetical protein
MKLMAARRSSPYFGSSASKFLGPATPHRYSSNVADDADKVFNNGMPACQRSASQDAPHCGDL